MSSDAKNNLAWWEGAEDHRFALEVLQLPLRRRILILIAGEEKSNKQIETEMNLASPLAEYHLTMLEKALVIERGRAGWRATPTGRLYLEHVERVKG